MDRSPLNPLAPFPQFLLSPASWVAVFQVRTAYLRRGSHSPGSSPEIIKSQSYSGVPELTFSHPATSQWSDKTCYITAGDISPVLVHSMTDRVESPLKWWHTEPAVRAPSTRCRGMMQCWTVPCSHSDPLTLNSMIRRPFSYGLR